MAAIKRLYKFYDLLPEQLTEIQLVSFVCYLKEDLNRSAATMRISVSAIKYFYKHILDRQTLSEKIPYPKKEKIKRTILSGAEIKLLFDRTGNLKHRLFLKLTYSSGLRRSEILALQTNSFDWKNMQVLVRGKGKKDRYTILAKSIKADYDAYIKQEKPENALFSGRTKNRPLSENSTRWIINQAVKRAGIKKQGVCLHSLRHSFATHLLALNTDVYTVQRLMGHDDIRTTMEYFHLGNMPNPKPKSPMDTIYPGS